MSRVMSFSQIYPMILLGSTTSGGTLTFGKEIEEITVHGHIEEMGLTTELITTKDVDALSNYLVNKGLNLPSKSKDIINEYIGKKYSFVVSWISDIEKFNKSLRDMIKGMGDIINQHI